jgi:hypothetical protein
MHTKISRQSSSKPWRSPLKQQEHIGDFAGQRPYKGTSTLLRQGIDHLRRTHEFGIVPLQRVLGW